MQYKADNKTQHNTTQRNTTSWGNIELDQKLHENNWSKNAAHLSGNLKVL